MILLSLFILSIFSIQFTTPQTSTPISSTSTTLPPAGSCVFPYYYNGSCHAGCFIGTINGTLGSYCPITEIANSDSDMYDICYGVDSMNASTSQIYFQALNDKWRNCAFPFFYQGSCQLRTCINSSLAVNEPPWCPLIHSAVTDGDKMSLGRYCYEDYINGTYQFNKTCFETNAQSLNVNFTDPNEVIIIRNALCQRNNNNTNSPIGTVVCMSNYILGYNNEACVRAIQSSLSCEQDRDCQPPEACVNMVCKCPLSTQYNATANLCVFQNVVLDFSAASGLQDALNMFTMIITTFACYWLF